METHLADIAKLLSLPDPIRTTLSMRNPPRGINLDIKLLELFLLVSWINSLKNYSVQEEKEEVEEDDDQEGDEDEVEDDVKDREVAMEQIKSNDLNSLQVRVLLFSRLSIFNTLKTHPSKLSLRLLKTWMFAGTSFLRIIWEKIVMNLSWVELLRRSSDIFQFPLHHVFIFIHSSRHNRNVKPLAICTKCVLVKTNKVVLPSWRRHPRITFPRGPEGQYVLLF